MLSISYRFFISQGYIHELCLTCSFVDSNLGYILYSLFVHRV